jgi:hypothetical protein
MNENEKYEYSQGLEYFEPVIVRSLTKNIRMPELFNTHKRAAMACKKRYEYDGTYTQNSYILGIVQTPIGIIELAWIKTIEGMYFDVSLPYFATNVYTWYPLIIIPDLNNNNGPTIKEFLSNPENYPNAKKRHPLIRECPHA